MLAILRRSPQNDKVWFIYFRRGGYHPPAQGYAEHHIIKKPLEPSPRTERVPRRGGCGDYGDMRSINPRSAIIYYFIDF